MSDHLAHLTPLNALSVGPSVRLSVRPSGKVTFGPKGPWPSAGARKKPPVGGLNFLVSIYYLAQSDHIAHRYILSSTVRSSSKLRYII